MKKMYLVMTAMTMIFSFTGCGDNDINFSKDVFLKYTSSPAGECASYEFYDTNVEVSSDGTVKIYCDDFEEAFLDEYPTKEIQLSEEDISDLKDAIRDNNIMSLPKDISEESCDGGYDYLTVYTEDDKHTTGGLNVDNKKFKAIEELLYGMIEEDYNELRDEVGTIQKQGFEDKNNVSK